MTPPTLETRVAVSAERFEEMVIEGLNDRFICESVGIDYNNIQGSDIAKMTRLYGEKYYVPD